MSLHSSVPKHLYINFVSNQIGDSSTCKKKPQALHFFSKVANDKISLEKKTHETTWILYHKPYSVNFNQNFLFY